MQCIEKHLSCNGQTECVDGSDEMDCFRDPTIRERVVTAPPPGIVHFNLTSMSSDRFTVTPITNASQECPESHFQCPGKGYCLPVFLMCNGVKDCHGQQDEMGCGNYTCHGFYRCRGSLVCLHTVHVCDSQLHCPLYDDEAFCNVTIPDNCARCHGLACTCTSALGVRLDSQLRYLDAAGSGLTQIDVANSTMLVYLSMARCHILYLQNFNFPNLRTLDLRQNRIKQLHGMHIEALPVLTHLFLAGNPLNIPFEHSGSSRTYASLRWLDLSYVKLETLNSSVLVWFPYLHTLNLSNCGIRNIQQHTFHSVKTLRVLDMSGCPVTLIPGNLFNYLEELHTVLTDNYKLCCPAILPLGFNLNQCRAPTNEISSCDDLLRSGVYRVALSAIVVVALMGNVATFVSRTFIFASNSKSGFAIFVSSLSMSDFLMGVYLAIIGIADRHYLNKYLWEDSAWRHSVACKVAGFLSVLSTEVSAMTVCLITVDRFIVLCFPFSFLRFKKKSATVACVSVWITGCSIAAAPLTRPWHFYSQFGICIPLPVTSTFFKGQEYVFGIMIIFNFFLFLTIAFGQVFVFLSIRANSMLTVDKNRKSQDVKIARGLVGIVVSDFVCWFPIGLLGLLASQGTRIPGEVSVALAVIVLPLNSALNPFLYNLSLILQNRQSAREKKIIEAISVNMQLTNRKVTD